MSIGVHWRRDGEYREITGDSEVSIGDHWRRDGEYKRSLETWR